VEGGNVGAGKSFSYSEFPDIGKTWI